jgi:hypothetical protein
VATVRRLLPTNVAIAAPASVASPSDSAAVDVPGETGVTRPADGPGDFPDEVAAGEPAVVPRIIPYEPRSGAARTRRA